jgi:soluble lytic murein transglycosylase
MRHIIILSIILVFFQAKAFASNEIHRLVKEVKNESWSQADKIAKTSQNKYLQKYLITKRYLSDNYNQYSFEEIASFIMHNPSWPYLYTLRNRAERLINKNSDQRLVFLFLSKFPPVSPAGYKNFVYVAEHFVTSKENLSRIIKNGWVNGNFDQNEQAEYQKKFHNYIGYDKIFKRADLLLWSNRYKETENIMALLKEDDKKLFAARIALQKNADNKFELFDLVPEKHMSNSGLLYDYCCVYKKLDKLDEKAIAYVSSVPSDKEHATQWWKLKAYFIRELIKEKKYAKAYEISKLHNGFKSSDISEGEFLAGWLALRFLNDPVNSIKHFENFNRVGKTPTSVSRGNYWLARAYKENKKNELARQHFKIASLYNYKFYGMLAALELGSKEFVFPKLEVPKANIFQQIQKDPKMQFAKKLINYDVNFAIELAMSDVNSTKDFDRLLAIVTYLEDPKNTFFNMELSRKISEKSVFILKHLYPIPFKIKNSKIHPSHTYSVIKHESSFNQYAVDPSNNTHGGLMQIIPETACSIAKSIKVQCDIKRLTTDPEYNLLLGNSHLYDLKNQYDNSLILVTIAYNAGSHRVKKWINESGDPRDMKNLYDVIDWIELIPFQVTRNYVQRMLENVQIYHILTTGKNKLEIENLMMRGHE